MSTDWEVGDLALCVEDADDAVFRIEGSAPVAPGPIVGLTYTVAEVREAWDCFYRPGLALRFHEIRPRHPRSIGYNAKLFRKVQPPKADAFDLETINLMNPKPVEAVR